MDFMDELEKEEEKRFMLEKLHEQNEGEDLNIESTYEEIESEYNEMLDNLEGAAYDMYPNGRDYDAENFDD